VRIYIVRHGETEHNRRRILQGHDEVPLNDTGIRQAAQAAARLSGEPLDRIVSSDLRRTVMTAAVIASVTGVPLAYEAGFRERNPGIHTGQTHEEGKRFFYDADYAPEEGEGVPAFDVRIKDAFTRLAEDKDNEGQHIAVVTHGLVCTSFANQFLRNSIDMGPSNVWPNASISIVDYDGAWTPVSLGDASHMDE
jgi:broad specificity phosphatase PhoE